MMRFEYKQIITDILLTTDTLNNEYGCLGWELIHIITQSDNRYCYIFKRKKHEDNT